MTSLIEQIDQAATFIQSKFSGLAPLVGIILGTGLSGMGEQLDATPAKIVIPFPEIPYFARSTVEGHAGNLLIGSINNIPVFCMQGRFHFYEGYSMLQVTFPIRVLAKLGIKVLVVSNAAGCLVADWKVGDIALITDHINFQGTNPLIGPNIDCFPPYSVRFPDMSNCYDDKLRALTKEIGAKQDLILREGVYIGVTGPSFETMAEVAFFKRAGADCVGMSTVPEVIVARHSGLRVLGFSVMTNMCVPGVVADHKSISEVGKNAGNQLIPLLRDTLPLIVSAL